MELGFRRKWRENDRDSQWNGRGAAIDAPGLCTVWCELSGSTKRTHKVRKHGRLLTARTKSKQFKGSTREHRTYQGSKSRRNKEIGNALNKFTKPKIPHFKKYQHRKISTVYTKEPEYSEINCKLFILTVLCSQSYVFVFKMYYNDLVI